MTLARILPVLFLFAAGAAFAQAWPVKPVRMLGVNSIAELVALAKAKPGLGYATSGSGSLQHMAGEWFAKLAGIQLTHVPYKGGGQAVTDLVGGTPQEFARLYREDYEKYARLTRELNIKLD